MKTLLRAIKFICNIVIFFVYALLLTTVINFVFAFVLTNMGKEIPLSDDIVHVKMAVIIFVTTFIITVLNRKYFYFSLVSDSSETKKI